MKIQPEEISRALVRLRKAYKAHLSAAREVDALVASITPASTTAAIMSASAMRGVVESLHPLIVAIESGTAKSATGQEQLQ